MSIINRRNRCDCRAITIAPWERSRLNSLQFTDFEYQVASIGEESDAQSDKRQAPGLIDVL